MSEQKDAPQMETYQTKIGHAHLKVRDLDRAIAFYTRFSIRKWPSLRTNCDA